MAWVVPADSNADGLVRGLLEKYPTSYRLLLRLGGTYEEAKEDALRMGCHDALTARETKSLFNKLQGRRSKLQKNDAWVVVFQPGTCHPVNKNYNRLIRDPRIHMVVVSNRRSVLRDDRLTFYDTSYQAVEPEPEEPKPWIASWLF